ncbi:MAG: methionine--tRNA ligase [Alphaproteobacteria bacterium]|nr:methionine--tRNA ligase [Alphaproteobacteria bacterium]
MSEKRPPFYITTPIYYVNDVPHIGHAYTTMVCDVLARFKRLDGCEVFFLTGTDEHGQKIEKAARTHGIDPQRYTDEVSATFRNLARDLSISNDDFIRTTEPRHIEASQALWRAIAAGSSPRGRSNIYLGKYSGWYAVRDEAFYDEAELTEAAGGKRVAPSGAEVEWVEESSYFFRLADWQEALIEFHERHPDAVAPPTRRNEVLSFIRQGLRDLSVSRTTFAWGVPVPEAPGHVMYVWLDALTNYITAIGYPNDAAKFEQLWAESLHVVGKDILRFHTVYWPAFLMAAGLSPPKRVFAHGWWTNEGQKISKSLGNVIDPYRLVERYGLDAVRYFLLREVPLGQDGEFSHAAMVRRMNTDLANDLGNLGQRVLTFINKNAGAAVPQPGELSAPDRELLDAAGGLLPLVRREFDQQAPHRALEAVWQIVSKANRYVDEQAPWALRKTDPARMDTVLYGLAEVLRRVGLVLQPFMPAAMGNLLDQLAVPADQRTFAAFDRALAPGMALPKPTGVFPRFVEAEGGSDGAGR